MGKKELFFEKACAADPCLSSVNLDKEPCFVAGRSSSLYDTQLGAFCKRFNFF